MQDSKRTNGGNVSKRAELWMMMIRVRDSHQRRKLTIVLQKFMKSSFFAEEVGISKTACHEILTENLGMHRIAAKFVPRMLMDDQKQNRVDVSQELLDRANGDDKFLKNIITGDETWVYDVETKVQSSQWVSKTSPRPKKHAKCVHTSR